MAKGLGCQYAKLAPTTNFHSPSLTTYHKTICMPRTPKYFCMKGSPYNPSGWLESGHHSQSFTSPWTPSECTSGPSDTCSRSVWMGRPLLWDHWHGARPPENSLSQMLSRWVPWPQIYRPPWSTVFQTIIIQKEKEYFGYSRLIKFNRELLKRQALFNCYLPNSDLFGTCLALLTNACIVLPGIGCCELDSWHQEANLLINIFLSLKKVLKSIKK